MAYICVTKFGIKPTSLFHVKLIRKEKKKIGWRVLKQWEIQVNAKSNGSQKLNDCVLTAITSS